MSLPRRRKGSKGRIRNKSGSAAVLLAFMMLLYLRWRFSPWIVGVGAVVVLGALLAARIWEDRH